LQRGTAIRTLARAFSEAIAAVVFDLDGVHPFLLDWMERGAINFNSPRSFAPAGTFAPDALLIVAG
jgi:hypothetical protein